jgi:endo-1,4-beta-xylanase
VPNPLENLSRALFFSLWLFFTAAPCPAEGQPALKDVFKNDFLIGAALNEPQFGAGAVSPCEIDLVKKHFNTISPENVLKWEIVHPHPDEYNFGPADQYVNFGVQNGMFIVGHNLVWHHQTPDWVFTDARGKPLDRAALLRRMHDHIATVMGRYKGKIGGWDVVNEALNDNGTLRDSSWRKIIGDDYIIQAYRMAHEVDPSAQLYYNDYGLESASKRSGALALARRLRAAGIPLAGVGLQGHYNLEESSLHEIDAAVGAFARVGVKVMITELDVDVLPPVNWSGSAEITLRSRLTKENNPYPNGLPDAVQRALSMRYADLFKLFVRHRGQITRVTFWGVTDADSWLNDWPVPGRTDYPLLFGRGCETKPAFNAVVAAGRQSR